MLYPEVGDVAVVFGLEWKITSISRAVESRGESWGQSVVGLSRTTEVPSGETFTQSLTVLAGQLEGLIPKAEFARVTLPEDLARAFLADVNRVLDDLPSISRVAAMVAAAMPPEREVVS